MKKIYFLLLALISAHSGFSQISHGGRPIAIENSRDLVEAAFVTMPPVDVNALAAEDAVTDQYKDIPYRFGHNIPVSIGLDQWTVQTLEDGSRLMRLGIESPGAVSINLTFSEFDIPAGAKLFAYDADLTHFIGSFTEKNVESHGGLALSLLFSDRIVLEYYEPAKYNGVGRLHIETVTHGYRNLLTPVDVDRGPFGNSGSCNINVACPLGLDWQDQIRSVALIVVGGNAQCTGSLVNNTAEDGTPYFLTANHCLGGNVNNWVFYFNHQSANCNGNTGPTNQTVSGASLKANNGGSDFALLELNSTPPSNYNVFYNGWDRNNVAPTSSVGIHHPSGDVKKISFDGDAAVSSTDGGAQTWRVLDWDQGTTEPGSSGSPLYNQNGHVVGQLYGGTAACGNNEPDWYGKFAVSWDGSSASTRLRDWLDPLNTGVTVLNGLGGAPLLAYDAALSALGGIEAVYCGSETITPNVTIRNNGTTTLTSLTINWTLNGAPGTVVNWTGSLSTGQQAVVNMPNINPGDGTNNYAVTASAPNGQSDGNVNNNVLSNTFNMFENSVEYSFVLTLDNFGSETTWDVKDDQDNVLYSGGPYENGNNGTVIDNVLCLGNGCFTFTIYDDWGDGICCGQWGDGNYSMLDNNNSQIFSGGQFSDEATHEFCITSVGISQQNPLDGFTLFPNPATDFVYVNIPDLGAGPYVLEVSDITGRTVISQQLSSAMNSYVLNTALLNNGMYLVKLAHGKSSTVKQLILSR